MPVVEAVNGAPDLITLASYPVALIPSVVTRFVLALCTGLHRLIHSLSTGAGS
jgi:hypothetical protein